MWLYKKFGLCLRLALIASTLILQVAFWVALVFVLGSFVDLLILVLLIINVVVTLNILIRDTYPEIKIPWIIILNAVPLIGAVVYMIYGKQSISKKRRLFLKQIDVEQAKALASVNSINPDLLAKSPNIMRQSEYIRRVANAPAYINTEIEYFPIGEDKWTAMLRELKTAEKFI